MRQRLKLATALVHDPDWLFLDEPTSGLDPKGRIAILELVGDLADRKGLGVILSTHLLADVESVCSEILVLREGRLLAHRAVAGVGAREQLFEVDGFGHEENFIAALRNEALAVERDGRLILVTLDCGPPAETENEAAVAAGARRILAIAERTDFAPRRLRPRPFTLTDTFFALVDEVDEQGGREQSG
jgi:ABC-type multidrug transport system ATPase subunit